MGLSWPGGDDFFHLHGLREFPNKKNQEPCTKIALLRTKIDQCNNRIKWLRSLHPTKQGQLILLQYKVADSRTTLKYSKEPKANHKHNLRVHTSYTLDYWHITAPARNQIRTIASLNPYHTKSWVILARVSYKSPIKTWSNERGEGKLFSLDLLDASGEIRCTLFNDSVDTFYDRFQTGKVANTTS